jgi:acyl dehydratase
VRRYAAATRDPSALAQAGIAIPPVALVIQIWDAQEAGRTALVAPAVQGTTGGVHGEHEVLLHRPIRPGEGLRTWVERQGSRPAGQNSLVTLHFVTLDAEDVVVAEQWWSTVFFGTTCESTGTAAPAHAFPEDARHHPVGTYEVEVDEWMAQRYAEVSGDWSPHHFEVDAARRSGADRPFLHGLCTMALCAQGVVHLVAADDPDRVRRVAVRFAAPMPIGEVLTVRVHDAGALGFAFEADGAGTTVISHGRAELR